MANKSEEEITEPLIMGSGACGSVNSPPSECSQMSIDDVLKMIASPGRFQIATIILMMYLVLTIGQHFVLSFFIGNDPPWRCISRNSSEFCEKYFGKDIASDTDLFYKRCHLRRNEWTFTTDKSFSFVTEYDLVCEKTSAAALTSSSVYMGGIVGSMIAGTASDAYGRKPVLLISLFVTAVTSIGCSYITAIWQLSVLRGVLGAASVACYFTAFVSQSEFISTKYRTISANMFIMSLTFSHMVIDLFSYFERHWRRLQLYSSFPCILAFILLTFLPESPRWLLATKRKSRAKEILEKIARLNGKQLRNIELKSQHVSIGKKYTYIDLFRHWKVLLLTISIGILWTTIGLIYYALALESSSLGGNMYQAFALAAAADIPTFFISAYTCDRFGRKKSNIVSLVVAGILIGLIALIPKSLSWRYIINIVIVIVAKFFTEIAFNGIYTWTFELYPTVLRSQGLSVCVIFQRVGLLAVPFLTTLLQSVSYVLPFIFMFSLTIVASVIGLTLTETNNLPTRETFDDFFPTTAGPSLSEVGIDKNITQYSGNVEM